MQPQHDPCLFVLQRTSIERRNPVLEGREGGKEGKKCLEEQGMSKKNQKYYSSDFLLFLCIILTYEETALTLP